jgi:hypothetical protein
MPNGSFRAYVRIMMPDWLDYDRLQALLAGLTILAVLLALIGLALSRRPIGKILAVLVFSVVAVAAVWQIETMADARRTDCTRVKVFGSRVMVPHCSKPPA